MMRKLLAASALIGLLVAVPLSQAGAAPQATRTTSSVTMAGAVVGTSTLTRTESGIAFTLETSELEPGHAITIWWMVANPDSGVAVLYAAGHVVGGTGTATFSGYLAEADTGGWVMGDDEALEDALTATVSLVVRDHGPGRADILDDQIRTFGACNPTCTDLQMSEHQPR
jgi:hypothetical protein